jgi:hypothetical protein
MDEHLAGDAANVEARPAERTHFDQSHAQLVKSVIDDGVSGAGADDAEVKVTHPAIVPARPQVSCHWRYRPVALAEREKIGQR